MKLTSLILDETSLVSKITRNLVGERSFDSIVGYFKQNQSNLFKDAWKWLTNSTGWLVKALFSFVDWSLSGLVEWVFEKLGELVYFDFAQSDVDIAQEISQNNQRIAGAWGNLVGSGLVRLVSVGLAGVFALKFPVVGSKMALALAEDAGQQIAGEFSSALMVTGEALADTLLLGVYASGRWALRQLYPDNPAFSGNGGRKPWILAEKIEETVEKLPGPPAWKAFITGALDGAGDALSDIGYIIVNSLEDTYDVIDQSTSDPSDETEREIEIFPDEESDESIIIRENQSDIEDHIIDFLNTHELVRNRDVGTIVGQPYDEWYTLTPQSRKLVIEFRSKEKPPFADKNGDMKRAQIAIPNAKPGIGWTELKAIKKYTWGEFLARGVFEDRRQMSVWGSSEAEAKNTLIELANLSSKNLIQISVSHPVVQNKKRRKKPGTVYPAYATMLVRKSTVDTNDYTLIDGQNASMAKERVEIWRTEKPADFNGFP